MAFFAVALESSRNWILGVPPVVLTVTVFENVAVNSMTSLSL